MFKAKAALNFPIGERMYTFICEGDSPLEEVIQVLKRFLSISEKMLEDATKQNKANEEEKKSQEQQCEFVAIKE